MAVGGLLKRFAPVIVAGVVLYLVTPALLEVFGAWDDLGQVQARWWIGAIGFEVAATFCFAEVQRLALGTHLRRPVIASNLAGGSISRVLPGGAAVAAALQFSMLRSAGFRDARIITGLAVSSVILIAALCALPMAVIPAIIGGAEVPQSLKAVLLLAAGLFAALSIGSALLLWSEGVMRATGAALRWGARLIRRGDPDALPGRVRDERDRVRRQLGRTWPYALLAAAGRWTFDFLVLVAAIAAVHGGGELGLVLVGYAGAQLLAQLPVTPGGLGVVEAGLTGALALAGVPAGAAAAATLAYRIVSYWMLLPAGLVAYLAARRANHWVTLSDEDPSPTAPES